MSKLNNKKIGMLAGTAALVMVAAGSLAYFSDRADLKASGTAGSVKLNLTNTDTDLLDENGQDILNPGDVRPFKFSIENKGNKSIDVRTTLKLTSTVPMGGPIHKGDCEFELYNASDVELKPGYGYVPKADATPIASTSLSGQAKRTVSSDGLTITYTLDHFVLDGDDQFGDARETEKPKDGDTDMYIYELKDNHEYDYVLLFRGESKNEFQNAGVQLDVLVEAKQHRNLGDKDEHWNVVATESVTAGNITQNAVPSANPAEVHGA